MFIYKYKKIDGLIRQQKSRQSSLRLRKVNYYFIFIFTKRYEHFVWTQLQPNIQI